MDTCENCNKLGEITCGNDINNCSCFEPCPSIDETSNDDISAEDIESDDIGDYEIDKQIGFVD
jgi:hypothetical protein